MSPYLWKRIWRRPLLSMCSFVLSCVLCFLMGYLSEYRANQTAELETAKKNFPIACVVTDIRGTKSTGLRMKATIADFVTDPQSPMHELVKEVNLTKEFIYNCPELGIADFFGQPLVGVSSPQCDPLLDPDIGREITWLTEDFYAQDIPQILLSQSLYQRLSEPILTLAVTDPCVNPNMEPNLATQNIEFRIAGYYAGEGYDMFLSYAAAQKLEKEYFYRNYCDSISFLAADNLRLDELSRVASGSFHTVDPRAPAFSQDVALTIYDQQYRATVAALEQNIRRTSYLLPLMVIMSFILGFLTGFLGTRNEGCNYALMRTVGMPQAQLFLSVLAEQLIPVIGGSILLFILAGKPIPAVIYVACHAFGCIVSVFRAIRVPPTTILREQE